MSFAILRHAKISSTTKGGAIAHNHRHVEGEQININPDLENLNQYFFGGGAKARIDEKLPAKMRKDAVVSVEVLLTASPEFFDGLETDRAKLAKNPVFLDWVQRSKKWVEVEFGKNLVDLVLHMDESTPHFHALAVPLTKDGRLCAKEVTARTEMQRRQTGYAKAMEKFGLKRGDPATETKRRHIKLKEAPGSGGQASQLAAQLAAAQAELTRVRGHFERLQKLSAGDLTQISALKKELAEKNLEIEALKAQKTIVEGDKTALEAFSAKWASIPIAKPGQAAVGTVVDVCGRQVVYHIGRGNHVIETLEAGRELPKPSEQLKPGLSR
jgi:hypothetical protein